VICTPWFGEQGLPVWIERVARIIALMMLFGLAGGAGTRVRAQGSARLNSVNATNIITDRLTDKDLRRWEAIKRIVFAEDIEGQPLHPTLRGLWDRLERSGHVIYIEMRGMGRAISNTAGVFNIERLDPEGMKHVAVIRLYPETIDRAYVGPGPDAPEGFIPFQGLGKEERYAEVLGHEMAHAAHILSDMSRVRLVKEVVQDTNEMFLSYGRRNGYKNIGPEMLRRLSLRDAFLKELEEPANAAEKLVWREILWGRESRKGK
jgi:hypothetical protein